MYIPNRVLKYSMVSLALSQGFHAAHYKVILYLLGTSEAFTQADLAKIFGLEKQYMHRICKDLLNCGAVCISHTDGNKKYLKQAIFQKIDFDISDLVNDGESGG